MAECLTAKHLQRKCRVRLPEIKISRSHHNRYCPCGQSKYESQLHRLRHFTFSPHQRPWWCINIVKDFHPVHRFRLVAQVCLSVHLFTSALGGVPSLFYATGLKFAASIPHTQLVRQGLEIFMKSGHFNLWESDPGFPE